MKPEVTVILPVFNAEQTLQRAINSILSQSLRNFEFLIIDDGSNEETKKILRKQKDPRISIIELPENRGVATARNVGLANARGEFVCTMDADDRSHPNRLEIQKTFLQKNQNITLVGSQAIKTFSNRSELLKYQPGDSYIKSRLLFLNGSSIINVSTFFRKDFTVKKNLFYPPARTDGDHLFLINLMINGAAFEIIEKPLCQFYRHKNNLTKETIENMISMEKEKLKMRTYLIQLFWPNLTKEHSAQLARIFANKKITSQNSRLPEEKLINHCLDEKRSLYGESRSLLNQIMKTKFSYYKLQRI